MKKSLQLKVIALIVLLMLAVMATIIPISVNRQKNDLLEAARSTLSVTTDMLNLVIKNIMLSGEAPIAVDTLTSLQQIGEFKAINLYRDTGDRAFQDFRTLDFVNNYQNYVMFERTDRVEQAMVENPAFQQVVSTGRPITRELVAEREMEYFFPLRNEQSCWACHGTVAVSGPIRGIAHFKISLAGIYRQINNAFLFLSVFLPGAVIVFAILLIIAIRRLVLRPLLHIGRTVSLFGAGQLDSTVVIKSKDELGELAKRINEMFASVQERLRLSKYVSRSTDAMIRRNTAISGGQKNQLVVLFSDVRGFTRFADQADPQLVIDHLNQLLDVQSGVVEKYQGDIDKFMGDAVMAQFADPLSAVRAGMEMVRSVHRLTKNWDYPLHIGVGINYGEVVAGNIGSQSRMEFAVIGDTVNLASRLCGVAPP
ncbi:MAG: HAMP domain-containing protein, partial [Spirochaetes bacterium]|nr:HAMP domain-containing protein [Spirochaetota bacterium]